MKPNVVYFVCLFLAMTTKVHGLEKRKTVRTFRSKRGSKTDVVSHEFCYSCVSEDDNEQKKNLEEVHTYVKVSRDLEYLIFFLKKLLWGPMKVKFRHLWPRWSWPNVLAYQNFWSTMWRPLVAKFSNMCYFHHFLRVRWKRSPQSTGLPWKI